MKHYRKWAVLTTSISLMLLGLYGAILSTINANEFFRGLAVMLVVFSVIVSYMTVRFSFGKN